MNQQRLRVYATVAVLFLLYVLGLGMRRLVLETQYKALGPDFPFTLESALHYRRVKMIYDTGSMPAIDESIQYSEGVNVRRTYEFGSEFIQATLAKALPKSMSVGDRLRWIESAWFCLGIPFMALWIFWRTDSRWGGLVAGGFYAVMISSVIRSTGQELSKENFALPLLIAHLAFDALADRTRRRSHGLLSAFFLGWSLWSWDLVQYYVLLWAVAGAWRTLRDGFTTEFQAKWIFQALALILVGLLSPYYRSHGFILSPAMCLAYGILICMAVRPPSAVLYLLLPLLLSPLVVWLSGYGESYGHFASLLWAKIRFLNHKPADPSLLSFANRIMWVPALNSATIPLTIALFPAILLISLISALASVRSRLHPGTSKLIFYFVVSLLAFCFFVRFHVFLALFAAGWAGCLAAQAVSGGLILRGLAVLLLTTGFLAEAANTAYRPERWGRGNVYYEELKELSAWLKEHVAPDAVLANFGTSGAIAAYGKCPIVLHPKFESEVIRERVRQYGELLFKGTEKDFRDWADQQGAEYFVYAKGEFSEKMPELQMRYFVNALNPADTAPARLFEFKPARLEYFRYAWGNTKYTVFDIFTRADEVSANQHAKLAQSLLEKGDLKRAEEEAMEALRRNPRQTIALQVIRHSAALQSEGFDQGVHGKN